MPESTDPNPQPTPNSPTEVDWSTPDPDEVRLPPPKPSAPEPEEQPDPDNAGLEGDDDPEAPKKDAAGEDDDPIGDDPEEDTGTDEPPEFWSAEKKALWGKVMDPEVRAAIKEHVREVTTGTARKLEENAAKVRQAEEASKQAIAAQEQQVAWLQQAVPVMEQVLHADYAGIDWKALRRDNPAEAVRLEGDFRERLQFVQQAGAKIQQHQQQITERQAEQVRAARVAEHGKLAAKYPKEFATPEAASRTYKALGDFLASHGIPPDRINQTYEAPIVEIVRMAYKYKQLQAKAKGITNPKPPAQIASTTPTRVVPGARGSANPQNEATRQAVERLNRGERLTPEEAALAFR